MISRLRGKVIKKAARAVIIEVGDENGSLGYGVFVTDSEREALVLGQTAELWTYLAVRENAQELYGFKNEETLAFFEMLISISGIGPKTALNVLNVVSVKTLKQAVASGDATQLVKVSGIGRKIAAKIVMELRDKFEAGAVTAGDSVELRDEGDALEALKSLGYPEREAREALKKAPQPQENLSASEKVKRALKILGQK